MPPTYQKTHPWLTFRLDLRQLPWSFWLMLGEAVSKCEHLAGVPLDRETAESLERLYLARGALATTAIEGNTLTEAEAHRRIEHKLKLPRSKEYLGIEIDNIVRVHQQVVAELVGKGALAVTPEMLLHFNGEILRGLEVEEGVLPGKLRNYSVGVADYRAAPAKDLPVLLESLCRWLNEAWIAPVDLPSMDSQNLRRMEAILKAVLAHLYLAWIHPFGDGNGRTARMLEFTILACAGVPVPAAHLLSNHYNETRSDYYRQLSRASKSGGDLAPFLAYAVTGFVDQLRQQIEVVRQRQLEMFWQQHVHRMLGDSETGRRRRYLVLDLSEAGKPIRKSKLPEVSVRVLRHYARRSDRTIDRDVAELEQMLLIRRDDGGYVANRSIVEAYLPKTATPNP
jgi:Fic family protein